MASPDSRLWSDGWSRLREALLNPRIDPEKLEKALRAARARQPLPVVWLLGKAQAGKTSIIHALTGSPTAEIGDGFQPCTRTARFYDFPAEVPVVRFLDTRGLGEVA
ncbi:MAG: 50S ribosome-binding GTPase, partial [Candidatus Competibacteraceae bacterium]|nr:50S ribosome-binding GTPase [Candidatus Competibacteraceae bacterium]